MLRFALIGLSISTPNFSWIEEPVCKLQRFCQVCEKKKQRNVFDSLITSILGMVVGISLNSESSLPCYFHCKFDAIKIRHQGVIDA